jgi:hypothetical protein
MMRMDSTTYMQNPEQYKEERILIATDLTDLLENYDSYKGKHVEISAPVTYVGKRDYPRWYLTLEEDGKELRCYEDDYRFIVRSDVIQVAKRAKHEGDEITVIGKVRSDGVELNQISYKNYVLVTDYTQAERYYRWRAGQPSHLYYYQSAYPHFPKMHMPKMHMRR